MCAWRPPPGPMQRTPDSSASRKRSLPAAGVSGTPAQAGGACERPAQVRAMRAAPRTGIAVIPSAAGDAAPRRSARARFVLCAVVLACVFIGGRLVHLAFKAASEVKVSFAEPMAKSWSRPDVVDRHGRLLATDVGQHSLYADPQLVQDMDEAIEKLTA